MVSNNRSNNSERVRELCAECLGNYTFHIVNKKKIRLSDTDRGLKGVTYPPFLSPRCIGELYNRPCYNLRGKTAQLSKSTTIFRNAQPHPSSSRQREYYDPVTVLS